MRVGDLCSAALNTLILNGECDESTSGRSYRCGAIKGKKHWRWLQRLIDRLFSPFGRNHCMSAYIADLERAQRRIVSGQASYERDM
jgi:hypothetical protein